MKWKRMAWAAWGLVSALAFVGAGETVRGQEMEPLAAQNKQAAIKEHCRTRLEVRGFAGHTDGVYSVAFSPDGKLLASGSGDKTVKLWDVATGKIVRTLEGHTAVVTAVCFSPDGKFLVSGSLNRQVILWKVENGEVAGMHEQACPAYNVAFLPDSEYFLSTCGAHLRVWNIHEAAQVMAMQAPADIVCLAVDKEGAAATGDHSGTVTLWDTSTGQALQQKSRPRSLVMENNFIEGLAAFSNGDMVISDTERSWRWNTKTNGMTDLGKNIAASLACVDKETRFLGRARDHIYLYKAGDVGRFIADVVPALGAGAGDEGSGLDRTMEIHGMAVSPKGDFFAIAYGGQVDKEGTWRPSGPRNVDVFSVAAALKWYDETAPKGAKTEAAAGSVPAGVAPWK